MIPRSFYIIQFYHSGFLLSIYPFANVSFENQFLYPLLFFTLFNSFGYSFQDSIILLSYNVF